MNKYFSTAKYTRHTPKYCNVVANILCFSFSCFLELLEYLKALKLMMAHLDNNEDLCSGLSHLSKSKLNFKTCYWFKLDQSVTFVKILIRMNVRIYSYQQNYTIEYPNIFILIFFDTNECPNKYSY